MRKGFLLVENVLKSRKAIGWREKAEELTSESPSIDSSRCTVFREVFRKCTSGLQRQ